MEKYWILEERETKLKSINMTNNSFDYYEFYISIYNFHMILLVLYIYILFKLDSLLALLQGLLLASLGETPTRL